MPRIRTLKPSFWGNAKVARVSRDARLLFVGLLNLADDEGRLLGSPRRIIGELFPHDDDLTIGDLKGWLTELTHVGLCEEYEAEGLVYYWLPGWDEHQRISHRTESTLPAPSSVAEVPVSTVRSVAPESLRKCSGEELEALRPEVEGEGEGKARPPGGIPLDGDGQFVVDDALTDWVRDQYPDVDWERETAKFVHHALDNDRRSHDWSAAWKSWIGKAPRFAR